MGVPVSDTTPAPTPLAANDPRHGTTNGYGNLGCRCQPCRDAHAANFKQQKVQRRQRLADDDPRHGSWTTYSNHMCRCRPCKDAWRDYYRALAERRAVAVRVVAAGDPQ